MKDLCKAMGICWHEPSDPYCVTDAYGRVIGSEQKCLLCGSRDVHNPSPANPAFCWRALTYMLGREDWAEFLRNCYQRKAPFEVGTWSELMRWLLSDPARFIELADEWCREHTEKGE